MSFHTSIHYAYRENQDFFVPPPTTVVFVCVGYAPSKGRRCTKAIREKHRHEVLRLTLQIRLMQQQGLDVDDDLLKLASLALCSRFHRPQAPSLACEWRAHLASGLATPREPLHDITAGARNTTRGVDASIDHRRPVRRQAGTTIFRDDSEPATAEVVQHHPAVQRRAVIQQNSVRPAMAEIQHGLFTPSSTPGASGISDSIVPAPLYIPSPLRPREQEAPATSAPVVRANSHLPRGYARPAQAVTALPDPSTATVVPPLPTNLPAQVEDQAEEEEEGEEEEEEEEEEEGEEEDQPTPPQPQSAESPTPTPPPIQHLPPAPDDPSRPIATQPPVRDPTPTPRPPLPRPTIHPPTQPRRAEPAPPTPVPIPSHTPHPPAPREDVNTSAGPALQAVTQQRHCDTVAGMGESGRWAERLGADMCLGVCLSWAEQWMCGVWV